MHILLVHQYFTTPSEAGGTRHYEFCRHLVARGHEATVVASDISYLSGRRLVDKPRLTTVQDVNGIRVLRAYTYPSLHRSFGWRVVALVCFMGTCIWSALRAGRVDVVMSTSPPLFQPLSAWLVSLIRRRPFLLEIRDLWPEFAIAVGVLKNPVLIALARWLERFLYARATHLLVNSPAYCDYLASKGVPRSKITLIANGVDPDMFGPQADGRRVRDEFGLNGQFVATYAGALGLSNDIGTILAAADLLRDEPHIRFLIVGEGKDRRALEQTAQSLSLSNVIFTGSRLKSEMADVLAASDVCLATLKNIPMYRTTYPNKVFDYMAAGRPTVLAIDGVIRQVIEAADGGVFVAPGDAVALADAVRRLFQHPDQARHMGRAARDYVVQHFNRHDHARAFEDLLAWLAMRRRRHDSRPKANRE